jgi:D-alanyl-D-alanine carboxypeptidase
VALAEKVAGSTEAFATRMNHAAALLGLSHSTFYESARPPEPGQRRTTS